MKELIDLKLNDDARTNRSSISRKPSQKPANFKRLFEEFFIIGIDPRKASKSSI